jgi:hypothetical protein
MWAGKAAPKVAVAKAPTKPSAAPKATPPAEKPAEAPKDKKTALLEKAKRLKKEQAESAKKTEAPKAAPAKGKKAEETPAEAAIPDGYNKKSAWNDVCELKDDKVDDAQVEAAWLAAIAEIAPDGDEDKLDAAGWWAVKESTLNDVGVL